MRLDNFFKKIKRKRSFLTVDEALEVIKQYKIRVAEWKLVKDVEEAVEFANAKKYPVILKVVSPDIVHKTDVGCVFVDLKRKEDIEKAYRRMVYNIKKNAPRAKIKGFIVQRMIEGGQPVIIGGKKDPQFGQVVMFGLGGVFVEMMKDVSFRACPINKKDAIEMIEEIKGYKILKTYRGKSYDINSLVDILLKTSKMLVENQEIEELDINPVFALPKGAMAVDARIVLS